MATPKLDIFSGFLVENQYANISVFTFKGTVSTQADLPATATTGDIYHVTENNHNYAWNGTSWADLGASDVKIQYSSMPTASASFNGQVVQYIGATTSDYEQGLFYICENQGGTYSWNYLPSDLISSTSDFGLVKIKSGVSEPLQITNGVLTANKATGSYSVSISGNGTPTNSATNIGVNSTAHGWYATALGCDAVVGDNTNDVRVAGAIQLGRGSNQEAGTFKVGLSTNGTTWNNYKLVGSDGKIPSDMLSKATASDLGLVKPDGTTITIDGNGVVTASTLSGLTSTISELNYTDGVTSNIQTQLNGKQNNRTTVEDTSSTSITLANASAGTDYIYGTLTSLTVTANDTSLNETTIQFQAGNTITVSLPNTLKFVDIEPVFEANKKYVLAIFNNNCVVAKIAE